MKQKTAQHFLDSESDGRTKKDQVTEKVHRLRRRLNPRSNTVQWRYRIEENHSEVSCSDDDMALDEMCRTRDRRLSWDGTIDEKSVVSDLNRTPCGVRPLPVSDGISMRASDPNHHDIIEYRVKPYSCFLPEKMYMTEQEIYNDSMRQSEAAEFVKSFVKPWYPSKVSNQNNYVTSLWGSSEDGRIGSLRVEVLGCIGLPKNKPDVGVYLVCGDSAFSTDVINAARSPMWPAKSKRAVVFPLMHAFLHLYVGVFDVLTRRNAENDTFFGRAMVDIAMLRPHTEYDVTLPLRNSSFVYERRPRGVVRLRFSLHWFSGRAAVLSYLREPQNLVPAYEEIPQPSIRCADPKTFRNIAVTVHGSDLPGKYTRKAFQATTREFNLYRLNVLFALKTTAQDAVMYEKPILSLYLFMSWMHCVYLSSMRLVPVYTVGTLVYMLVENYRTFILHRGSHLGYSPVTLREIFMSLLTDGAMEPFVVAKKVKHRSTGDSIIEVETRDHREFPFSEKVDYPKLTVEESVLRRHTGGGRKERKEELHIAGRLSVYIKAGQPADQLFDSTNRTVSSSSTISLASADDVVNEDNDNDTEGDEDHDHEDIHDDSQDWDDMAGEHADDLDGCNDWWCESGFRRIPSGPPQDTNVKPRKKIPPQVHLARLEETLNRFTQHISQDRLYWRTLSLRPECEGKPNYQTNDHDEEESANTNERRKKRLPLDDFDKKLGLRRRHPNPVVEITSSFLGPLMRIFRIICITVRVVFNISVWRDPFLSFWALCALLLLMLILVVFPWRFFFCVLGTVALGPQNMLLRNHLYQNQNRNAGDDQDEQSDKSNEERIHHEWKDSNVESETHCGTEIQSIDNESIESATLKRGNNRRRIHTALANLKERRQRRRNDRTAIGGTPARPNSIDSGGESNVGLPPRQPFSGVPTSSASFRRTPKHFQPREIVVPYSRFRKERFYDWPPDPTVSRATPVNLEDCFCNGVFEGDIPREKSM
eukprot:CAMPEP_0202477968 /NCGR_PEP_ID=MMETSP1360-20130828/94213_1 /ASSEMBLY_ACC=CAM_ASM_000848 /TAXON_ID=515479 /ORGANISM="Licmophora paradoxa, Strain CCMP2313" /LENGTH=985 /DNA_ID=CAMNT_0049105227 /DNA_START=745 /DNA_END=3702 /DNA_ORIENTATION=-